MVTIFSKILHARESTVLNDEGNTGILTPHAVADYDNIDFGEEKVRKAKVFFQEPLARCALGD